MTQDLTEQEVFDRAVERLKVMKTQAATQSGACRYRSEVGPCLVGIFIPDELYTNEIEGYGASGLPEYVLPGVSHLRDTLLSDLQNQVHDDPGNWGEDGFVGWGAVAHVASVYRLTFKAPTAA